MTNRASSSLAYSSEEKNHRMENGKYGKERRIRRKYRGVSGRRTLVQRGYYESQFNADLERREGSWSLSRGKSRWFGRGSLGRGRRRRWRTRLPGRIQDEWRKFQRKTRRCGRRLGRRGWKWYESPMDLGRKDRRRSRRYFIPRRRRSTKEGKVGNRPRRRWRRRRISRWGGRRDPGVNEERERKEIGENGDGRRTEFSRRKRFEWRNIRRWRRSSRRWTERRRRTWYRYQGRRKRRKKDE